MGLIAWIILGAFAGWIASKIAGTDKQQGWLANIIVGIIGAMIGGFVFDVLGGEGVTGFNLWSLIVSVVGALLFLWIVKSISGPSKK